MAERHLSHMNRASPRHTERSEETFAEYEIDLATNLKR